MKPKAVAKKAMPKAAPKTPKAENRMTGFMRDLQRDSGNKY